MIGATNKTIELNVQPSTSNDKRHKYSIMLVWACFLVYVLMMGSKNAYTAEIVAIQGVFEVNKATASLAMTYYFVAYAAGQVLLSTVMSRINLRVYLIAVAGISSLVTVFIAFMPSMTAIYVLCTINGALQAGIYSGCMAVLSKNLNKNYLPFANKLMSVGTAIASMISYGVPALFVALGSWNMPFIVLGILFAGSVAFFFYASKKIKAYPAQIIISNDEKDVKAEHPVYNLNSTGKKVGFFALMMTISLLGNAVYYAVLNWIPSMMNEVHSMPQEYSILITLLVPISRMFCPIFTISVCEKRKNIFMVATVLSVLSLITFVPFIFLYKSNIVVVIILLVAYNLVNPGISTVYTSIVAFNMRSQINTGSYTALVNAVAAIMAGVAPPIAGAIIDAGNGGNFGITYILCALITVIQVVMLLTMAVSFYLKNKKAKGINA